jgi:DNA-binding transcriptional MerR regulator
MRSQTVRQPSPPAAPAAEYRMRDLVRASGLPRETIRFYLGSGMLPPARKTGRNTALYGDEHLDRLRRIGELRTRHFLPLKAIRAVLVEARSDIESFTPSQRVLIEGVRAEIASRPADTAPITALRDVPRRTGLSQREISEFRALGMIDVEGQGAAARLGAEDLRILELWSQAKVVGGFRKRGVTARHAAVLRHAVEELVRDEMRLFADLYAGVSGSDAASVLEGVLPLMNEILGLLHRKYVRRFFERDAADAGLARKSGTSRRRQ